MDNRIDVDELIAKHAGLVTSLYRTADGEYVLLYSEAQGIINAVIDIDGDAHMHLARLADADVATTQQALRALGLRMGMSPVWMIRAASAAALLILIGRQISIPIPTLHRPRTI
jgi:hypothetical protein